MNAIPYHDPRSGEELNFVGEHRSDGAPWLGAFSSPSGNHYPVHNGLPDFVVAESLGPSDQMSLEWYSTAPEQYDSSVHLTFSTFGEEEDTARNQMVDFLDIQPGDKVLEIGCGSGRDSVLIAQRLGPTGVLAFQDIAPEILQIAATRLEGAARCRIQGATAGATKLPFADAQFDRVFHFGGFNTFGNQRGALAEMVRVTRPGGRIVFGDESIPPWLRETQFSHILINSSPLYESELPLGVLPVEARNVRLHWIIGGVFYLFVFDRGEGEPIADIDFEIPGVRGGTHRKRYFGKLEGIDPDIKQQIIARARQDGVSVSAWLENACLSQLNQS